jgi:hypothetical protein
MALESTIPVLLFDQHRTPYRIETDGVDDQGPGVERVRAQQAGPCLYWARPDDDGSPARWTIADTSIVARVRDDQAITPLLRSLGGDWGRLFGFAPVKGGATASVWVRADGSVLLPFDPNEAIDCLWTEGYLDALTPRLERALGLGRRAYYGIRPVLPRSAQIAFRRRLARRQARTSFPRWPIETSLHDLYDLLYDLLARIIGQPLPALAPWPAGRQWAFVITHDVETAEGLAGIEPLRAVERRHGLVSAWNFVPERYPLPAEVRTGLVREGCEIGVHGLRHDGRDVASVEALAARLPAIQAYARAWGASGFRAPAMQRSWAAMRTLGFDHDSSFPDTDPFQPCRGGCCSWWPLQIGAVVELPLTLAQDHTLFVILDDPSPRVWIAKAQRLRERAGLAQVLVHPDYIATSGSLAAYEELLAAVATDTSAWFALPSEVSAWWRARAATRIDHGPHGWEPVGPASAEAVVKTLPVHPGGARNRTTKTDVSTHIETKA